MAKRLCFTIDGQPYHAILQENPLAEKIAAMCPFEKEYIRGGDHEYYAALPEKAAAEGCADTTEGRKNRLYYFESWNALSLVIDDCNTAPYRIHYIGDFEEDISAALKKKGKSVLILCQAES